MNKENEHIPEESVNNDENTLPIEENKNDDEISNELINDFTPEPIKIPNYNVEKEHAKLAKEKEKQKKRQSKKNRKRRRAIKKALVIARTILLVILLTAVISSTLIALIVRINTSEYSIESAIRTNNPESFVIGKIKNPKALNLNRSSTNATITDILRDNAMGTITYADIVRAVNRSSYSDFIAENAHGIISYFLYGTDYSGVSGKDVSDAISENISYIKLVTGVELGQSACSEFEKYVDKSSAFKDLSPSNLKKMPAAQYTNVLKIVFSIITLAGLAVALMLLLIAIVSICHNYSHILIGWCSVASGIIVGTLGFLFNPGFATSSKFIQSVYSAIINSFHTSSLIYGAVVVLVGIIVLVVGKALTDDYDEDYDEEMLLEEND